MKEMKELRMFLGIIFREDRSLFNKILEFCDKTNCEEQSCDELLDSVFELQWMDDKDILKFFEVHKR